MKTLIRLLAALLLTLSFAVPASAGGSIKPNPQLGRVMHGIGTTGRKIAGDSAPKFFRELSREADDGVKVIVSAVIKRTGTVPSADHVARALSQIGATLKTGGRDLTLQEFLEMVAAQSKKVASLDEISRVEWDRLLVGLMTKVKEAGVHELSLYRHTLGKSNEIVDLCNLSNVVSKIQVTIGAAGNNRARVEAMCKGNAQINGKNIGMAGEWALESKCWKKFSGARAENRIYTQFAIYFKEVDGLKYQNGVISGPGKVALFSAAGPQNQNLGIFLGKAKEGARRSLQDRFGASTDNEAALNAAIDAFIASKLKVVATP